MPGHTLSAVTLLVPSYDEGIAFFCGTLGWALLADQPQPSSSGAPKRWVEVAPPGGGVSLVLAVPADAAQTAALGNQTGGRVGFFLASTDFAQDHAAMLAAGITFLETPRHESYGTVAKWRDPFGNLWDLIEFS